MLNARSPRPGYRLKHGDLLWEKTVHQFVARVFEKHPRQKVLLRLIHQKKWYLLYKEAESIAGTCTAASSYYEATQLSALVKKYRGVDPKTQSLDPENFSRDVWLASERQCQDTSLRLSQLSFDTDLGRFVLKMRTYIESVLGASPDFDTIYDQCDFSSGASIGVHGDSTNLAAKFFAARWTCTPRAYRHALEALSRTRYLSHRESVSELSGSPLRAVSDVHRKVELVSGNKLAFVPKTMATHRAIAVEPLLNSFVQRGVDLFMRDRLRLRLGIDLTKQEPNQRMARLGSESGLWATIDLSSASDTMAWTLVRKVLPREWFSFLSDIRSHRTNDPIFGSVDLWKFCSMGNNFCFPLQTLIFAAICHAAGSERGLFRVYGDDIICESARAPLILERLRELGFTPNPDKTFFEGPFRESCGTDWWNGEPVRPAYAVKKWDDVRNVASFHNTALRLWPESWLPILDWIRSKIPPQQLLVRPYAEQDGNAFNAPLDQCMTSSFVHWDRKLQNWSWVEFISTPIQDCSKRRMAGYEFLAYLAILRGSSSDGPFTFRRKTRTGVRRVSRWPLPAHVGKGQLAEALCFDT